MVMCVQLYSFAFQSTCPLSCALSCYEFNNLIQMPKKQMYQKKVSDISERD